MYDEVAEKAGKPNAYRAVGATMKQNYSPDLPCHRVVGYGGNLGG